MNPRGNYRVLAFEQLETKRSPTSLLLLLAPSDDDVHAEAERAVLQRSVDTAVYWRHHHSAAQLLHFVEQQTADGNGSLRPWTTPSPSECAGADQAMGLQDEQLRTMVIAESLDQFDGE